MSVQHLSTRSGDRTIADVLALGFGTTVAMWAVGYVGRLPVVMAPGSVLVPVFLACVVAGGFLAGRLTERGWSGGLWVGLLSGAVNLLVLGGLLTNRGTGELAPSAAWWVPGFLAASAVLGAVGAAAGAIRAGRRLGPRAWAGTFVKVGAGATLLLLAVGGLVTSHGAGLAVVDWPNSYGYNMFLFPLSRMTGGIYYEHAHRLFGALVGLTTLVMAAVLQRVEERAWVRRLAWGAFALVVVQGILGGLRVTGRFTLSTSPQAVAPNVMLAVVHGVLGQIFLATMVALAVFTSGAWRTANPLEARPSAATDRWLGPLLTGLVVVQVVLGAVQRHLASGLMIHVTLAVIVALVALATGARAWGLNPASLRLRVLGHAVVNVTIVQLMLGAAALVATHRGGPAAFEVTVRTAHQWCGAMLLACVVTLTLWTYRLLPSGKGNSISR